VGGGAGDEDEEGEKRALCLTLTSLREICFWLMRFVG